MIGNYSYNPKNPNSLKISDVEEFILGLLKDICKASSNSILQNAKVNFENELNLMDLAQKEINTKMLLSFKLSENDSRNNNLLTKFNDLGNDLKIVYEIGAITHKNMLNTLAFTRAFEEVIAGMTNNWNGTNSLPTPYIATLSNNKILTSPLTLNIADDFPLVSMAGESTTQPNYLTAITKIVFIITK